jgi:dihydrofolate reductase
VKHLIEYTLISTDGVVEDPARLGYLTFRDEDYIRDGLGLLTSCSALLMGRMSYEGNAVMWPERHEHPWTERLNAMPKYVFSSTLRSAEWNNTQIVTDDAARVVAQLKQRAGGPLLIWGHTALAQYLMAHQLTDILDLSIHPLIVGSGNTLFRENQQVTLRLGATKTFSHIVKLTYHCEYQAKSR